MKTKHLSADGTTSTNRIHNYIMKTPFSRTKRSTLAWLAIGLLAGSVGGLLPVGLPGLPGIFLDGDRREELEQAGAQLWPPQRYHPLGILDQKTSFAERAAVKGGNGIAGIFEGF